MQRTVSQLEHRRLVQPLRPHTDIPSKGKWKSVCIVDDNEDGMAVNWGQRVQHGRPEIACNREIEKLEKRSSTYEAPFGQMSGRERVNIWLADSEDLNMYHKMRSEPGEYMHNVQMFKNSSYRKAMKQQRKAEEPQLVFSASRGRRGTSSQVTAATSVGNRGYATTGGTRPKEVQENRRQMDQLLQPLSSNVRGDDGELIHSSNGSMYKDKDRLKSGFLDKPRSQVVVKLMWPHMNQNPRYVTSSLTFNQLNFAQFVGGECRTIMKVQSENELVGRLQVLSKVAYLYDQCRDWEKARNAYFAILSSIEEGEASWVSSFGHYDIMCPPKAEEPQKGEPRVVPRGRPQKKEFFCRDYQKGDCGIPPPHKAWIKNSYEVVDHFCAGCFKQKLGNVPHGQDECPNKK